MQKFESKVAIISGGSTGIGKATIELLTQNGCKVYNLDINTPVDGGYTAK